MLETKQTKNIKVNVNGKEHQVEITLGAVSTDAKAATAVSIIFQSWVDKIPELLQGTTL